MSFFNRFRKENRLPKPQEILQALQEFVQADTWDTSQRIVEQHPELLTDEADTLLARLVEGARAQGDENAVRLFEEHRALLRRCREAGIPRAFAEKVLPPEVLEQAAALGLTPEQALEMARQAAQMPPEVREILAELAASGAEIRSPEDLERLLSERPDLQARLEAAVANFSPTPGGFAGQGGRGEVPIPPEFQADLQHANAAEARYLRAGDRAALDEAAAAWERILNHPSFSNAPERFQLAALNDGGDVFLRRYWAWGQPDDLQAALDCWQQAVQRTPPGHPDLPSRLNNLGTGLRARYGRTGRLEDLEEALTVYRQAVDATPPGHPDLPMYLNNLGTGLSARYGRTGRLEDLEEALTVYRQACSQGLQNNLPEALRAGRNWLAWAFQRRAWEEALEAHDYAVRATEARLSGQFERADKAFALSEVQGLAARAAFAAWRLGQPDRAVEILEQGRAQLLREALERQRRDLHALQGTLHEPYYTAYIRATRQADNLQAIPYDQRPPDWGAQLVQAQANVQAAIQSLRGNVPGFEYFLQSLPFSEIRRQAADTPLVYLAATEHGGLALMVNGDADVRAVELPALTDRALREQVQGPDDEPTLGGYLGAYSAWRNALHDEAARARWFAALDETCRWLWEAAMGPVVEAVGSGVGAAVLIPTGWLGLLPLHAAWTEDAARPSGRRYALDEIAFAYAPSAQALRHARAAAARPADSLLAVQYPDPRFQFADQAVEAALDLFTENKPLRYQDATLDAVKQAFGDYGVLFFFTHGQADFAEPLHSGLLTSGDRWLTLSDILALRSERARLAVLSACETGVPSDLKAADEVVSLPGGLMQAGIPGVVGSLWSVAESSTAILMSIFFEEWRTHGLTPPQALRRAQQVLRNARFDQDARRYFARYLMPGDVAREFQYELFIESFAHPFFWAAFTYTGL